MKMKNLVFACTLGLAGNSCMGMNINTHDTKNFDVAAQTRLSIMHHKNCVKNFDIQTTKEVDRKLLNIAYAYKKQQTPKDKFEMAGVLSTDYDSIIELIKNFSYVHKKEEIKLITSKVNIFYNWLQEPTGSTINNIIRILENTDKQCSIIHNIINIAYEYKNQSGPVLDIAKLLMAYPKYYDYIIKTLSYSIEKTDIHCAEAWCRLWKLKENNSPEIN